MVLRGVDALHPASHCQGSFSVSVSHKSPSSLAVSTVHLDPFPAGVKEYVAHVPRLLVTDIVFLPSVWMQVQCVEYKNVSLQ
jgi:hypothetical protein